MGVRKYVLLSKTKVCTKCKVEKPLREFHSRVFGKNAYGLNRNTCKLCESVQKEKYKNDILNEFGVSLNAVLKNNLFNFRDVNCAHCSKVFKPRSRTHKWCSSICKGRDSVKTTEQQYEKISGNWPAYFRTLTQQPHRKRHNLTKEILLEILEKQNRLCALSGVELTCKRKSGTIYRTNASVDRIDPKGPYTKDNIQLVCVAVNKFRIDMDIEEYINWCRKVAYNADKKENV